MSGMGGNEEQEGKIKFLKTLRSRPFSLTTKSQQIMKLSPIVLIISAVFKVDTLFQIYFNPVPVAD